MSLRTQRFAAALLAAGACAATAGTVNVSFVNADTYWDAGWPSWDQGANLKRLSGHLEQLGGQLLPQDQVLSVDVLQVDLARTVRVASTARVMNGGADWPRLLLRYRLEAPGRAPLSGEEWVSDQNYLRGMTSYGDSGPLFYERRMLTRWFKARFAEGVAAPG